MKPNPDDHSMAVDVDGGVLPFTSTQVNAIVADMMQRGRVIALIVETEEGLGVQVFGPPSRELGEYLTQAAQAYQRALQGH